MDWPFDPETGELMDGGPAAPNVAEFTVGEISQALKRTLEDQFGHVRIRGEISGFRGPHASGHCYFCLKDSSARIDAVIWKGSFGRLRARMQEGLEVVATGKVSSFPGQSKYQLIVENLEPAGAGALMALLEERRRKLAAEGLFDAGRKKPLPMLPAVIGVVTSPTGAVIRDILHRLADRFPRHVIVWPVRVQGETCAAEVAAAIRGFNALEPGGPVPRPDLLIVARGGGSLEDLWGFNEEIVVRAAAESAIPLISAVGHETDTTLIDHAADWRAPTPTAAAEKAVPVRADLIDILTSLGQRQRRATRLALEDRRRRIIAAARGLPRPDDILAYARQRFDAAGGRLTLALRANTQHHRRDLATLAARLTLRPLAQRIGRERDTLARLSRAAARAAETGLTRRRDRLAQSVKLLAALSYRGVLARGFALVTDADGHILRAAAEAASGQPVTLTFADGSRAARIEGEAAAKPKPRGPGGGGGPGQGSLF